MSKDAATPFKRVPVASNIHFFNHTGGHFVHVSAKNQKCWWNNPVQKI